jgi:hypothetical protein
MTKVLKATALAFVLALGALAPALTEQPKSYLLRLHEKVGAKYEYNFYFDMNADMSGMKKEDLEQAGPMGDMLKGEQTLKMVGKMKVEVVKVEKGKTTLKQTLKLSEVDGKGIFQMGAPMIAQQMEKTETIVLDERGRPEKSKKPAATGNMMQGMSLGTLGYPEKPISRGATWTVEGEGSSQTGATATFFDTEQFGAIQALRIEVTMPSSAGLKASGPVVMLVDPATGRMLLTEMIAKVDQAGMKMRMHIKVQIAH